MHPRACDSGTHPENRGPYRLLILQQVSWRGFVTGLRGSTPDHSSNLKRGEDVGRTRAGAELPHRALKVRSDVPKLLPPGME